MRRVMEIVSTTAVNRRVRPLVVLSACAGVTNALLRIAELSLRSDSSAALSEIDLLAIRHETIARDLISHKRTLDQTLAKLGDIWSQLKKLVRGVHLLHELTPKSKDQFQAMGELCSTTIFAAAFGESLRSKSIPVQWLDAREFFRTSSDFVLARPILPEIQKRMKKVNAMVAKGSVGVTQGFIGSTADGITTTIGRGGGDFSAAIMGVAIESQDIQIWTDVAGIYTCDPRIAPNARPVEQISFNDASQLAYFGAKVLHPETIWPAVEKRIPVRVLSSKEPKNPGTTILFDSQLEGSISGIALKRNITLVKISNLNPLPDSRLQETVWDALSNVNVVPLAVSLSADSALYVFDDQRPLSAIRQALENLAKIEVNNDRSLISLVGSGLSTSSGIAARIFKAAGKANCEMISYGGSESTISFVVLDSEADAVTKRLHKIFFESEAE